MDSPRLPTRLHWLLWLAVVTLWVAVWLYPLSIGLTRAAGAFLFLVGWAYLMALTWKQRLARLALLTVSAFCLGFLAWPGHRRPDTARLRADYLTGLRRYEGVRYYWGGESPRGIDCSGLVRRGLIDAAFLRGVRSFDPALVRYSLALWWHDCTAKALGEQYRAMTIHQFDTPSLNALDPARLEPGDVAVAKADGVHTMAYLGGNRWIEADPEIGRVVIVPVPSGDNVWFQSPMTIVRWRSLQP